MRRRQVLALGVAALAGCTASPDPPDHSQSPPNVFLDHEWTGEAHRLTFEYGTAVTTYNTRALEVLDDETFDSTVWVSRSEPAEASFPLEPGDSLTVEAERETALRLVWSAPTGHDSALLDVLNRSDDREATG